MRKSQVASTGISRMWSVCHDTVRCGQRQQDGYLEQVAFGRLDFQRPVTAADAAADAVEADAMLRKAAFGR